MFNRGLSYIVGASSVALFVISSFASVAGAVTVTYSTVTNCFVDCGINGPTGNQRNFVGSDGSTMRARAFSTSDSSSSSLFVASFLGHYSSNGLGVTGPGDQHVSIDNGVGFDLILLEFDTPVNPHSITIRQFGDTDAVVWGASVAVPANLVGQSFSSLGGVGFSFLGEFVGEAVTRTMDLGTNMTVSQLLIGASFLNTDGIEDRFKIKSVTVGSPVPEPGTLALFGTALAMFGASRKRKQALLTLTQ